MDNIYSTVDAIGQWLDEIYDSDDAPEIRAVEQGEQDARLDQT